MTGPKWIREVIKNNVISESEAKEILEICRASETEEVLMPEHLHSAIERVAREEFGLVRDGEILVRFVPPRDVDKAELDDR